MKYLWLWFLLQVVLFCLFHQNGYAQEKPLSTKSKKAESIFRDAVEYYNGRDALKALRVLDRAISIDSSFIEAYILKGDILSDEREIPQAIRSYKKVFSIHPDFSPSLYFISANLELMIGMYNDAKSDYLKFLSYNDPNGQKNEKARGLIRNCDFGINALQHPVPFNPINLGDSINTQYDEYINTISADEQRLFFTRKVPANDETIDKSLLFEEDFYCSVKTDSIWSKAWRMSAPINTHGNEGALCISPDGQYLFFAACNRPDGYGSCDLYWAKKNGNGWTIPENMGPVVNSPSWDSQPSFSSDGKTLYFASKRPGGKGSSDIWKTELGPDGSWSVPVNLGDSINTPLEEMAPFIHPDDRTLYFSSRGHMGMGGLDLFFSRKNDDGQWTKPVNLGYPINTWSDEITLVVNASGELAYISSDKLGGKGKQDIYAFKLYKEAQPVRTTYFKGIVYDAMTKQRLEARFELTDLKTGKIIITSKSDPADGEFLLSLPINHNYALNVSKEGYLFYSDNFLLSEEGTKASPVIRNVPLRPIRVGETVILKNIFFDTDKFDLKPESMVELEKLTALLKNNPLMKIEISGHTDNVGTAEYNQVLSNNRARAVYDWLIQHGISGVRLSYAGYGLTRPIDTNDTEQGRANNRRTEFKVIAQ